MGSRSLICLVTVALLVGCGGDSNNGGPGNNNGVTPDAGNADVPEETELEGADPVTSLNRVQRDALCAEVADAIEPGAVTCEPHGQVATIPGPEACEDALEAYPECVTVADVRECTVALAQCDPSVFTNPSCYFLFGASHCESPADDGSVTDLDEIDRELLCWELTQGVGGPGSELDCDGVALEVPTVDECTETIAELPPCAAVGAMRSCFEDMFTCGEEPDREECWFLIGDDGSCTAPYIGQERVPVAFSVLPPVPSSCDSPGTAQRIPFVYSSADVVPIVPGDLVHGLSVQPNVTLDSGSIAIRRPRISELTEQACASAEECSGEFLCASAGLPGARLQCTVQTGVNFVPATVRNDYDPNVTDASKQLVGVLIENTAMLDGRLPLASGGLFDENGEKDILANPARASDPSRVHRQAIKDFLVGLASVASPTNTLGTVWWYGGQLPAEARPLVYPMQLQDHWSNDLSIGDTLVDAMPNPVPKPGNLYQAMLAMFRKDYNLDKYASYEKFLYVFTDGPNEVYDEEATYEKVLAAAEALGIHIFIVHLDAEVDPSLIRDVPTYWAGNDNCQEDPGCAGAPPCSSDGDCANFETCRPATVYAETENDQVTTTPVSYCMPQYNDEGRLGPIDRFADLACRTGGNYVYVTDPEQMRHWWRVLPSTVDGQFSVEADFSALADEDIPHGFYRLSGVFLGLFGGRDLATKFTAPVDGEAAQDNRPLIRFGVAP